MDKKYTCQVCAGSDFARAEVLPVGNIFVCADCAGVVKSPWISADDPPQKQNHYYVRGVGYEHPLVAVNIETFVNKRFAKIMFADAYTGKLLFGVTHWMEIPPLPQATADD